jgi:hypothetical protein
VNDPRVHQLDSQWRCHCRDMQLGQDLGVVDRHRHEYNGIIEQVDSSCRVNDCAVLQAYVYLNRKFGPVLEASPQG